MEHEQQLARDVINTTEQMISAKDLAIEIEGIPLRFPGIEVAMASWNDPVPAEVYESYNKMVEFFKPESFPNRWIPVIKRSWQYRRKRGIDYPIDIIVAAHFTTIEHEERARELGIPNIEYLSEYEGGSFDLRNSKHVEKVIDGILADHNLREHFITILDYLIPDGDSGYLNREPMINMLKRIGINKGIILDLGCGTGRSTCRWSDEFHNRVIGVERQYHPRWYDEYWKSGKNNLTFIRSDISQGLPFPKSFARVVLLENVVPHMSEAPLAAAFVHINRVLKEDGFLLIGPQDVYNEIFDNWLVFQKQGNILKERQPADLLGAS